MAKKTIRRLKTFGLSALWLLLAACLFITLDLRGIFWWGLAFLLYVVQVKLAKWWGNLKDWLSKLLHGGETADPGRPPADTSATKLNKLALTTAYLRQKSMATCTESHVLFPADKLRWVENLRWSYTETTMADASTANTNAAIFHGQLYEVFQTIAKGRKSCIVLGKTGVGKTAALQKYILHILSDNQRFKDETGERPLVFLSLSSWDRAQTLRSWISRELQAVYLVQPDRADLIAQHDHVIPVLDGLDQVPAEFRASVMGEIYTYATYHENRIVVTCRPEEFQQLREALAEDKFDDLFCTLTLKRLLRKDAMAAILNDDVRSNVETLIQGSVRLEKFALYPLGLSMLVQVVDSLTPDEKNAIRHLASDDAIFARLWDKYEHCIFDIVQPPQPAVQKESIRWRYLASDGLKRSWGNVIQTFRKPYSKDRTQKWLRNLRPLLQTNFSLENLQPSFLLTKADRFLYFVLSRILCTAALSIAAGFFLSDYKGFIGAGVIAGCTLILVGWVNQYIFIYRKPRNVRYRVYQLQRWLRQFPVIQKIAHGVRLSGLVWYPFIVFLPVVLILWLYFGFATPHLEGDMIWGGSFAVTEANLGLFLAMFVGSVFGLRDLHRNDKNDIRLMARTPKNYRKLLQYGFLGSIGLTLTLVTASLIALKYFPSASLCTWASDSQPPIDLITLSIKAGLVCGFPLFGMLGLLDPSGSRSSKQQTNAVHPGVILLSTLKNGRDAALVVTPIVAILFGVFFGYITRGEITSIAKGVRAGFGVGLLTLLWSGGFDLIQYYTLKLVIVARGRGPYDIVYFLDYASRLRFTTRIGASYNLVHPTLGEHLRAKPYTRDLTPRPGRPARVLVPIILIGGLLAVAIPFYKRYFINYFWKSPHGCTLKHEQITSFLRPLDQNTFVVSNLPQDCDTLEIRASGRVKAGEFVGYVSPAGTEAAFLGFPIGNSYDLDPLQTTSFSHCALLVRKTHGTTQLYSFPKETFLSFIHDEKKLRLSVRNGDTLHLIVNDKEWHNNAKSFQISITMAKPMPVYVIAHRGGSALAPENTITAIKNSLRLKVDFIEIDIAQTRDNQLVLMHDSRVDATTDGTGKIADMTWREIAALKIDHSGPETIRVPRLTEVLDVMKKQKTRLLIEVKNPDRYPDITSNLLNLLREKKMTADVLIFSMDANFINRIKNDAREVHTGYFAFSFWDLYCYDVPEAEYLGINYYGGALLLPYALDHHKASGKKILAWTINSTGTMQHLLNLKIDGIITDRPDKLQQLIAQ